MGDVVSYVVLADGTDRGLAGATRRTAPSHEAFQILCIDAPDGADLDAEESLADKQPAHIGR